MEQLSIFDEIKDVFVKNYEERNELNNEYELKRKFKIFLIN